MARQHLNLDVGGDEKLKMYFMWPKKTEMPIYEHVVFIAYVLSLIRLYLVMPSQGFIHTEFFVSRGNHS